jgi:hypothetical protein
MGTRNPARGHRARVGRRPGKADALVSELLCQLRALERGAEVGLELVVDDVGEVAFEAAHCFGGALAFGAAAGDVGAGAGVDAHLGQAHDVQGVVEAPVAAAVEAVAVARTRGGRDGCGAVAGGERVLVGEAPDVADLAAAERGALPRAYASHAAESGPTSSPRGPPVAASAVDHRTRTSRR